MKTIRKNKTDRVSTARDQYIYMLSFGERALPDGSLKQLYVFGATCGRIGLFGHIQHSTDQVSRLFDMDLCPLHITKWRRLPHAQMPSLKLSLMRIFLNCRYEWPGIDGGYAISLPVDEDTLSFIMSGYYRT